MFRPITLLLCAAFAFGAVSSAHAEGENERLFEVRFHPVKRAQIAMWIEREDLGLFRTLRLTEGVARRGIGNRPGALQMNSGFRWPYGRREGALPVWANRRIEYGGLPFRRVIFRDRRAEGLASQAPANTFPSAGYADNADDYFCLSFQRTNTREALDAVTCPSVFNSDKGRYITEGDVASGYSEPVQLPGGTPSTYALSLESLYPARRDVVCGSGCGNHPDVGTFNSDALAVMPELDAVAIATLPEEPYSFLFTVPDEWPDGEYKVFVEVGVEGDYSDRYSPEQFPTPIDPTPAVYDDNWDSWAVSYGYPYRGQPSVVYAIPFQLGQTETYTAREPVGFGSVEGRDEVVMRPFSADEIVDDHETAPGSGADRLLLTEEGWRLQLFVRDPSYCDGNLPPSAITGLDVSPYGEKAHSHHWAHMAFTAPSDDRGIDKYEVRVSTAPITDEASFLAGTPANAATLDIVALVVPATGQAGSRIEVDFGGLNAQTKYYVGIRARDLCNVPSPIAVAELETTAIYFTTVTPCVVATAAYGSPLAAEVGVLRRFRDRHLMTNAPGRAFVEAYYEHGPVLADFVREHPSVRDVVRSVLEPAVALATWIDSE